jgi:hypothetical protein
MTLHLSARDIQVASQALTEARETSLGIEVTTPVIYPNGDCVTVVVATDGENCVVHDAGFGSMHLTSEGFRLNKEMRVRFSALAARYRCEFVNGRMTQATSVDDIPVAIMLVANASRSLGDYAAEARRQTESEFRHALTEQIREIAGSRLRENEMFRGASGRNYRVQNTILDNKKSKPSIFVVALSSRGSVANQFRELYDLKAAHANVANDSVYKDDGDFNPDEDGWLLKQVGELTAFRDLKTALPSLLTRVS